MNSREEHINLTPSLTVDSFRAKMERVNQNDHIDNLTLEYLGGNHLLEGSMLVNSFGTARVGHVRLCRPEKWPVTFIPGIAKAIVDNENVYKIGLADIQFTMTLFVKLWTLLRILLEGSNRIGFVLVMRTRCC